MKLFSKNKNGKKFLITILLFSWLSGVNGQQSPLSLVSYWFFTPSVYNPAIVGSKDYFSLGLNAAFQGNNNTQLLSGNGRISKRRPGYFSSPGITEFRNMGVGGSIFKDINGLSKNGGVSGSLSYHLPLNSRKLTFLSIGASLKETYNTISTDSTELPLSHRKNFYTNLDLGIYLYGTSFFAGASGVNLLGSPWKADTLGIFDVPVSREYFFTTGFKILLSKSMDIVLEPSVLISATDSTFDKITDNVNYILKLYLDNFCIGASIRSSGNKTSVFAQYRYPRFYVGGFYEFKNNTPYYKSKPIVEFTLGINLQSERLRHIRPVHW